MVCLVTQARTRYPLKIFPDEDGTIIGLSFMVAINDNENYRVCRGTLKGMDTNEDVSMVR